MIDDRIPRILISINISVFCLLNDNFPLIWFTITWSTFRVRFTNFVCMTKHQQIFQFGKFSHDKISFMVRWLNEKEFFGFFRLLSFIKRMALSLITIEKIIIFFLPKLWSIYEFIATIYLGKTINGKSIINHLMFNHAFH